MENNHLLSEEQVSSIIEFSGDIISNENEFKAYRELLSTWTEWTKHEKLRGKNLTVEETIKLPQLVFKNISKLPLFLDLVLSHMRVSCVDLTESMILDYTELDELRGILSGNGMDFYEIVKLSRESKISLIRGDLLTKNLSEDRAVYEIILKALVQKDVTVYFEGLLTDKLPKCIKLLSEQNIYIRNCNNLIDLSSLAGCCDLQRLWIDSCAKLTSLSGLADPCPFPWRTYDSYKHLVDTHFPEGHQYLDGMKFWFNVGANDHYFLKKDRVLMKLVL